MRRVTVTSIAVIALIGVGCGKEVETTAPLEPSAGYRVVAASVTCGETVTTDVKLEADVSCPADALFVGADGLKIDLNGHTISGAGVGAGITVRNFNNVTITGGTIRGFVTGLMVATSSGHVIKETGFTENREGVFLAGAVSNTIKNNVAWANTLRGFMIRPTGSGAQSTANVVMDNLITDNPSGILVFGQPDNIIKSNTITGSTNAALDLLGGGASGNVFKDNLLASSGAGIKFGPGWINNSFVANTIQGNTCGVLGPGSVNEYKENVFTGNTTDLCP